MPNLLNRGAAYLAKHLKAHASDEVRYTRDAQSIAIQATSGAKLLQLNDGEGGVRMEWTDKDFIITAADLVIAGERIEPRRGDVISIPSDEGRRYYEVASFGGEPPWRYCDSHRILIRIHTKHVETEPPC